MVITGGSSRRDPRKLLHVTLANSGATFPPGSSRRRACCNIRRYRRHSDDNLADALDNARSRRHSDARNHRPHSDAQSARPPPRMADAYYPNNRAAWQV